MQKSGTWQDITISMSCAIKENGELRKSCLLAKQKASQMEHRAVFQHGIVQQAKERDDRITNQKLASSCSVNCSIVEAKQ